MRPFGDRLARHVEECLALHLDTDSFPSDEWPNVARAFAQVVEATGDDDREYLLKSFADLLAAFAEVP